MKKVRARFYRTDRGIEPVRDWLLNLGREDRKRIGTDIATVEYGWPVGMPTCRPMGNGLWEVRTDLSRNRAARVLFSFSGGEMILLHAFIKKSRTTPDADLRVARSRQKKVER